MDRLKNFPFMMFFMMYFCYVAYVIYQFNFMDDGAVSKHQTEMTSLQNEIGGLRKKLSEGQKFLKSLEDKKADLQSQVRKLTEYQGALSEAPDTANLIKTLISEAKQIELKVTKIEPGAKAQKEYYLEQEFKVEVQGSFQQIALFAQRVSKLQRILRIDAWSLRPQLNTISRNFIRIVGNLSIRAYQYTISKEDAIGKPGTSAAPAPTPPPGGVR